MSKQLDTVIIGGGQAGLSTSYYLDQRGREHIILEKDRPGESWRSKKWDSFSLVTPNWQLRLPGLEYSGDNPDGFLTRDEVVNYLDDYISMLNPPLRLGVEVNRISKNGNGSTFSINTSTGELKADNVVVATGTFQKPGIPDFSRFLSPGLRQMHSSQYRNPQQLPSGGVLVVGSAQSGCQIAEELNESGRDVYLATSAVPRMPRRYRGKDFTWWAEKLGVLDETVAELDSPAERFVPNPHVTGKDGGHTLNLHRFAKEGITLLGHLQGAEGCRVFLADDLHKNLEAADNAAAKFRKGVDTLIEKTGMQAPPEKAPDLCTGYDSQSITELDLKKAGVSTMIWATGYDHDFSWIQFPILDEFNYPIQKRGVTEIPGLYFMGLHWMHTLKSGLFIGVGEDARHVASHIAENR